MTFQLTPVLATRKSYNKTIKTRIAANENIKLCALVEDELTEDLNLHTVKFKFYEPCFNKYIEAKELRNEIIKILKELNFDINSDNVITEIYITHGTARENRKNLTLDVIKEDRKYFRSIGFGRMGCCITSGRKNLDIPVYQGYSTYYQ